MERVGRFELVQHLASGGMADVYLARNTGLGGFERKVAIKTLRPCDDNYVAMVLDEARMLGRLHHRHIVQAYEVDRTPDGTHYLVMEFVDGQTSRRVLQEAVHRDVLVPLDFSLTVITAMAAALHHAHEHGLVHRDVSPSNVIAGYDGGVKLIDFGIAKSEDRTTRTAVGFVKGKAGYMAPEQIRGYDVDHRTDVFALGILLYELTTRRRAFPATMVEEQLRMFSEHTVEPPSHVLEGYPRELERIVMTALEEDPDDRHLDARTMQLSLDRFAAELGIVLGAETVSSVLRDWFPPRALSVIDLDLEEDTVPYALDELEISVEDLLLVSSPTPTPIWARS